MTDSFSSNSLSKQNQGCPRDCASAADGVESCGADPSTGQTTRRRFLKIGVGTFAAFVAVVLAIPIIGTIINHAFRKRPLQWSKVGAIDSLSINQPERIPFSYTTQDAYLRKP